MESKYINEKLEEFNKYIRGKRVAIIGMGVSNIPLLDHFFYLGAKVTVFDRRSPDKIDEAVKNKIGLLGFNFYFGEDNLSYLKGFDIIFRSPSCRPDTPEIVAELERGAILTSEIEMVIELAPCKVIGVTGSDGKTTTTSLIYEILTKGGYNCFLGGNIGIPLFTKIGDMKPDDIVVLELSSFQLMNMKVSPDISVVTNVTPNHLDIHKSYDEYIDAKKEIFKHQDKNGIVVLNYDNDITKSFAKEAKGEVRFFSRYHKLDNGFIFEDGIIKQCEDGIRRHILEKKDAKLRGDHNFENMCTALSATKDLVDIVTATKAICDFAGVEHRLEFVKEINGVKWYNDSIGSSPTRTIAGLQSYDENIILIAGGYDKHLDYTPIAKPIVENVRSLILMGATAPKIYEAVTSELKAQGKTMDIFMCESLEETVITAYKIAKPGEVVLFSPASASFDFFKNFEERGKKFKELVNKCENVNE